MSTLRKKLIVWLKYDVVRTIFSLTVVVVIMISVATCNTSQEANMPTHIALIEDHVYIAITQNRLKEAGLELLALYFEDELQVTVS